MLRKAVRVASQLLILFLFVLIGHWVYARLLEDPHFQVREIETVGCQKIGQEILRSLATKETMPNLFSVKIEEIAKPLESHPWVDHVVVRKVFPSKIFIQIEERKPIAILQLENLYYIDAKGVIFSSVGDGDGYNYPFLTGLSRQAMERDPEGAKDLIMKALDLLRISGREEASPLSEISEVHMERPFGIECFTKAEGVGVRMGLNDFNEKLKRLAIIWSDLQKRGLSPMSIDCSDLKRMVVMKRSKERESGRR
jgi:cell division protein FtsQ